MRGNLPMDFRSYFCTHTVCIDGAMGTMLQNSGLPAGTCPEDWNIEQPEKVSDIHRAYRDAGANLLLANTFGANGIRMKRAKHTVAEAVVSGIELAKQVASQADHPCYVALDVGPLGTFLAPYGDISFDDAVALFTEPIVAAVQAGADCVLIETMSDISEISAAVTAAKRCTDLPVLASLSFDKNGRTMMGATIQQAVEQLEALHVDAIGANCSLGPTQLLELLPQFLCASHTPLLMMPNAGLPRLVDDKAVYDVTPEAFSDTMDAIVSANVRFVGGCCGTTPAHIALLARCVGMHNAKD